MSVSHQYREAWESFWRDISDAPGEAIWDSDPALTAAPHMEWFAPYADTSLPVVDLGCGNGTQTRYLATRFATAVGVDLSTAAVEHARRADLRGVATFRQLSLTDTDSIRELHERLGDSNVYMRAVIHQSDEKDRPQVAAAVAALIGTSGRAFVVELTSRSKAVLQQLVQAPGGPPPKLAAVFAHGLRPAEAEDSEVPRLLREAGLDVLARGDTALAQTEHRADGTRIDLPAQWFVLGRTGRPGRR
ncbi:class I SAM-dependent methyltransferase [Streptomyces sp. NPDC004647]|uniref:class I SAM-dependent methyltransferase n=1 Tax=Streptomyces sp. NPDC004647 TaxID=3154671 RepID=UPI0033BD7631